MERHDGRLRWTDGPTATEGAMPTEPDYQELLNRAQQCTEEVKQFLVAICNSPQGKTDEAVLSAAALTVEQLRMIEGQLGHIWELFQKSRSATHAPSLSEPAPPVQAAEPKTESIPRSWPD
jgi:hypothetical protein